MAIPNVALHILSQTWPEVFSCYKIQYLETSRVAGSGGIMILAEHVEAEVVGGGDV